MAPYFNHRALHNILESTILPWARAGELLVTVAEPDFAVPEGVTVTPQKTAPRVAKGFQRASQRDAPWMELGLHCRPNPVLMFVLDGEADMRVGRILESGESGNARKTARDYEVSVYSLPAKSCLIVPPDVAHSDGSTPHWERPDPEKARSQIFWMQILSTGAIVHICRTDGLSHSHNSTLFIRDLQLALLMHFFHERARQAARDELLASFIHTFLLCFDSSQANATLQDDDIPGFSGDLPPARLAPNSGDSSPAEAFDRACVFIDSHLTDALSPVQIARQTHISVSQLSRLFHARLGMPVMKYVTQRRLEEAKTLLLRTSLTTEAIGQICGYPHRTHFSRAFKAQAGASPNEFRRQAARNAPETS